MAAPLTQIKSSEIAFFDSHGASNAYDVFAPATNQRLIDIFVRLSGLPRGSRIADLGCGSGVFTNVLQQRGYNCTGVDLSPALIRIAREKYPGIEFIEGDIEHLPFADASFDGVLLAGVLHHFTERSRCVAEVMRILRPGGKFVAFDPNRMNPAMYLYRDRSSPFYSSVGVTENERPVLADEVAATFRAAGFRVGTEFQSGMKYRYIASGALRWLLPAYNFVDGILFSPPFMKRFRSFVFTFGEKPEARA
ncbi:MAG: class I SAM-dependent methyltransferase [Pseudolabrys sp.]|nr:class I SAM-dependent methyltransferase [Pseudolabrys sp.]MDP2296880.1 class I SAM-dependent methyltransferase [Pseudolabrys sp.]